MKNIRIDIERGIKNVGDDRLYYEFVYENENHMSIFQLYGMMGCISHGDYSLIGRNVK